MRSFKATLVIGALSVCIVLLLDAGGWLRTLEVASEKFLGQLPVIGEIQTGNRAIPYLLALVVGFALTWTTVEITKFWGKISVAAAALILLFTGSIVGTLYGSYHSPYQAMLTGFLAVCIALVYGRTGSGSRKDILERLIGNRLSRRELGRLIDSEAPIAFPGDERDVTVLVCEISNQPSLAEKLTAENYVGITNEFLAVASDYLVDCGGYLEECGGAGVRVIFGAPLPREDHATLACQTALELAIRLDELNKECDSRWQQRVEYRIGIHSGTVIGGAFGSSRHGGYSVSGPAVDFAHRLSAACSMYGTRILASGDSFSGARECIEVRPIDMLVTPARRRLELYEILADKGALSPERSASRDHFWKGVIHLREGNTSAAIHEFSAARISGIPDPALDEILLRTERQRRESTPLETPVLSLTEAV